MDLATCMYHTGLDPETMKPVYSAKGAGERAMQRALLQYWKAENHALVKQALQRMGRLELIGSGPGCLIQERPPPPERGHARNSRDPAGAGGYRRAARERGAAQDRRGRRDQRPASD
jgi:hypothetical protein